MNPLAWKAAVLFTIVIGAFGIGYAACKVQWDADVSEREKIAANERMGAQKLLTEELSRNDKLKDRWERWVYSCDYGKLIK